MIRWKRFLEHLGDDDVMELFFGPLNFGRKRSIQSDLHIGDELRRN